MSDLPAPFRPLRALGQLLALLAAAVIAASAWAAGVREEGFVRDAAPWAAHEGC